MSLEHFFKKYKIFIFAGNGGTGKTTLSSVWGELAARQGRRVALLTIDPSRRLGSVYGMDLQKENFKSHQLGPGQLDIYLIHADKIISDFITEEWGRGEAEKLGQNKIFRQISTTLSENQSLSTIYQLAKILQGSYDTIVVDTPPAHHAVDFFRSPKEAIQLFRDNVFARMMSDYQQSSRWSPQGFFLRMLTFLLGRDFVEQMVGFFAVLVRFQTKIVNAAKELQTLLASDQACYFMVTLPEPFKMKELFSALHDLKEQGIFARHIIVNKAYPLGLDLDVFKEPPVEFNDDFRVYYRQQWEYYRGKKDIFIRSMKERGQSYQIYFLPERCFIAEGVDVENIGSDLQKSFKNSESINE